MGWRKSSFHSLFSTKCNSSFSFLTSHHLFKSMQVWVLFMFLEAYRSKRQNVVMIPPFLLPKLWRLASPTPHLKAKTSSSLVWRWLFVVFVHSLTYGRFHVKSASLWWWIKFQHYIFHGRQSSKEASVYWNDTRISSNKQNYSMWKPLKIIDRTHYKFLFFFHLYISVTAFLFFFHHPAKN